MASDSFHHVEGTYPEPGLVRVYVFDDHTRPIDPKEYDGTVEIVGGKRGEAVPFVCEPARKSLAARFERRQPFRWSSR